jgi:hypothetical protein
MTWSGAAPVKIGELLALLAVDRDVVPDPVAAAARGCGNGDGGDRGKTTENRFQAHFGTPIVY